MEPNTTNDESKPAQQDPPHGGSWIRQADGSLTLNETTKPANEQPKTEPKTAGDAVGTQEE